MECDERVLDAGMNIMREREKKLTHDGLTTGLSLGTKSNNLANIILETLIEHSVGFIEDQVLNAVK